MEFDAEADFDVRSAVAPPKPQQIDKKLMFGSENFAEKKIISTEFFADFFLKFPKPQDLENIDFTAVKPCFFFLSKSSFQKKREKK